MDHQVRVVFYSTRCTHVIIVLVSFIVVIMCYCGAHVHRIRSQPQLAPGDSPARVLPTSRQSAQAHPGQPQQVARGARRRPAHPLEGRLRRLRLVPSLPGPAHSPPWACCGRLGNPAPPRVRALTGHSQQPAASPGGGPDRGAHPGAALQAGHGTRLGPSDPLQQLGRALTGGGRHGG